jgi:hypothetical protein
VLVVLVVVIAMVAFFLQIETLEILRISRCAGLKMMDHIGTFHIFKGSRSPVVSLIPGLRRVCGGPSPPSQKSGGVSDGPPNRHPTLIVNQSAV